MNRLRSPNPAGARFYILLVAILAALPGFALAEARARSILDGVPGLEKPVTYSETKIPLGELVGKIAADTGVSLRAAREVADEPVALAVKDLLARELLQQLADLLDYRWSQRSGAGVGRRVSGVGRDGATKEPGSSIPPTPDTRRPTPYFEIWQDLAGRQREEALRRAISDGVERRFQEEIGLCGQIAKLSEAEFQRLWEESDEWSQRLRKLSPEEQSAVLNSPEGKARQHRYDAARRLWPPVVRSMAGMMARLTPPQWASLRASKQIVFSSNPQAGEFPLPADALRVFRTAQPDRFPPQRDLTPSEADDLRRQEEEVHLRWKSADAYHVTVRFTPDYPATGWITFNAISSPVRDGQRLGDRYGHPIFVLNISPEEAQPEPPKDPRRADLLAQDPMLGTKRPFMPDTKPRNAAASPRAFRTLQDLLPDFARAYGVNLIADSYWSAPEIYGLQSVSESPALFALLDRLTGDQYAWDRQGSVVRVRSRSWFLDRPAEIPLRTVRRWREICDRLGALPLEEYAALATSLTESQLKSLDGLWTIPVFPPPLNDLQVVEAARHILRLYATLLPGQRQALWQGKALPLSQLPPTTRPLVLATLNRLARHAYPLLNLDQWLQGSLSLVAQPLVRVREERGGSVSYRIETPQRAAAAVPPPLPTVVRRYPVLRLKLQIRYGPEQPVSLELTVAPPARS